MICAGQLPPRREIIMVTENVLTAIDVADNLGQEQTTQLPPRDLKNLLDMWFKELQKPSDPLQTSRSNQNRSLSPKDQKLLERLKGTEPLSTQDKKQLERLQENLSPENQKLLERLLKETETLSAQDKKQLEQLQENLSQKYQKLLERLKGKENLSAQDKKQLEQLKENLSPENQKLIEKLLKVKEPPSAQDKKQLDQMLKGTENPSQPKELKHLEGVQEYFVLLNEALTKITEDLTQIKESESHPPHLEKSYIEKLEKLWSINNPYGFAEILEKAVDALLHFENKVTPKKTFLLYYFHRQQLQQAARKKLFSTSKQIGRVLD